MYRAYLPFKHAEICSILKIGFLLITKRGESIHGLVHQPQVLMVKSSQCVGLNPVRTLML